MLVVNLHKTRVPVSLDMTSEKNDDSRFQRVKIYIAHTGENLNNSYIEKETLSDMIPSLSYVPIVGYMEQNSDKENDFSDHKQELVIMDNGVKMRYLGNAYGFIPENPNAQFEVRDGKEWLTAEGYIWTKFQDAMGIFDNANGTKSQSMEITNVDGTVDDAGRLVITEGTFSALCILGNDVSPGMDGSTIEYYSKNNDSVFKEEVKEMILQFNKERGENTLPTPEETSNKTGLDPETTEFEQEQEQESEKGTSVDPEKPVEGDEDNESEDDSKGKKDPEENPKDGSGEKDKNFSLSFEEIRKAIREKLNDSEDNGFYFILETHKNYVIAEHEKFDEGSFKQRYERIDYTIVGNDIELGQSIELFPEFLTKEERNAVEISRSMYQKIEDENKELKEFKLSKENEEKETVLEQFSELDKQIIEKVRNKFDNLSVEDVQKELAFELYKDSQNYSQNTITNKVTNFSNDKKNTEYGTLSQFAY